MSKKFAKLSENFISELPFLFAFFNKDLKKIVMRYEHVDSCEKFNETFLPSKEKFYSELNNEKLSDKDYRHEQKVQNKFKI